MLLLSMKLKDFRQFEGEQEVYFSTDTDKNVTIIMGENGSGKTTFAQAFTWCLYGKVDFNDPILISKATAQNMKSGDKETVYVKLVLQHSGIEYHVTRSQTYQLSSTGSLKGSPTKLRIQYKSKDGQQEIVSDNQTEYKIKEILPSELSHYFFFDGERIGKMSKDIQSGNSTDFAEAVKNLLGLKSYTAAMEHLRGSQRLSKSSVIGRYDEMYDSSSDSRIGTYSEDIRKKTSQKEVKEDRIKELEERMETITQECNDLRIKIERNKDSERLARDKAKYLEKITHAENIIAHATENIMSTFGRYFDLYFTKRLTFDALKMLSEEKVVDKGIPDIHERTINFLKQRGTCICGTPIVEGGQVDQTLNELLRFIPPKALGTLIGEYVNESKTRLRSATDLYVLISDMLSDVRERANEIDEYNAEIAGIDDSLSKLESIGEAQRKLRSYEVNSRQTDAEIKQLQREIGSIEKEIERAETERSQLSLKSKHNREIEVYKQYALRIYEIIKTDYQQRETEVRQKFEMCLNEIFREIYNGGIELSIDEKYNVQTIVTDYAAFNKGVETSTAQSISIIFAFIAGVIKMAKDNKDSDMLVTEVYPLVMDAPLSSFDKSRIETVCNTLPNIAEQVIIFIKDTDGEIAEKYLYEKIGKRYIFDKKNQFVTNLRESDS